MGIDYHTCDFCSCAFPDCNDYQVCDTCDTYWCECCMQSEDARLFYYAGHDRCSECFSTEARGLSKGKVLKYALQKLGATRAELEQEMATLAKYDAYTKPQFSYTCQDKSEHLCVPTCTTLGDNHDVETPPGDSELEVVRGLCCRAKWNHPSYAGDHWCAECIGRESAKKSKLHL